MDVNGPMAGQLRYEGLPHEADSQSDGSLARRAAAGDRSAATELIVRHQEPVRRFLRRLTGRADVADDLAQETFIRMLRSAGRYDERYPMRSWLLTIARRLSINRGRTTRRVRQSEDFEWARSREMDPAMAVEEMDSQRSLARTLEEAMAKLTEAQRQALVLFHQQGLSVQETAAVMELPVGTVKSHLHRARASMRQIIGEIGPGSDQAQHDESR
jgi:RNA polymerase sigma-70 factor (ECF subfamily)